MERRRKLPNSLYEISITLIPKSDNDTTKKGELKANLLNEH
jgi:hypothetical protein